jgi:hypothetical protein
MAPPPPDRGGTEATEEAPTVTLKRLVVDFRTGELIIHCLYRSQDGAGPSTKARRREVTSLVRTGLQDALEALEGRVDIVGTSGFNHREDLLCIATPAVPAAAHKKTKRGA